MNYSTSEMCASQVLRSKLEPAISSYSCAPIWVVFIR